MTVTQLLRVQLHKSLHYSDDPTQDAQQWVNSEQHIVVQTIKKALSERGFEANHVIECVHFKNSIRLSLIHISEPTRPY